LFLFPKQHCIGNGGSYHSSTSADWWFHSVSLDTELWTMDGLIESKLTFSKWNENPIVHYELWTSILKTDIIWCKNWPCDCVTIYSLLNYHFCWYLLYLFCRKNRIIHRRLYTQRKKVSAPMFFCFCFLSCFLFVIIWCKNWPCDCVTIYSLLNYHFCWYCVFLKPI
jgi:hypothetical protein